MKYIAKFEDLNGKRAFCRFDMFSPFLSPLAFKVVASFDIFANWALQFQPNLFFIFIFLFIINLPSDFRK